MSHDPEYKPWHNEHLAPGEPPVIGCTAVVGVLAPGLVVGFCSGNIESGVVAGVAGGVVALGFYFLDRHIQVQKINRILRRGR